MKVLVVHPRLVPVSGAERVALTTIRALVDMEGAEVTVLTFTPREELVPLVSDKERRVIESEQVRWIQSSLPKLMYESRFALLEVALLVRRARQQARSFDLCVSTYNEADFGVPGIQYVHFPMYARRELLNRYDIFPSSSATIYRSLTTYPYHRLVAAIAIRSRSGIRQNLTLVNSAFIRDLVMEEYGVSGRVLYPPVSGTDTVPNVEKDRGLFSFVGRITPDKHIHTLVEHFEHIHNAWSDSCLTIAGLPNNPRYLQTIRESIQKSKLPVEVLTDLSDDEIAVLLRRSEFFINAKPYEHFGISVVEAINAGCIPFVFKGGGVTEIVRRPDLQFLTTDDLVEKILRIANNEEVKGLLRKELLEDARRFCEENFIQEFRKIVSEFLEERR